MSSDNTKEFTAEVKEFARKLDINNVGIAAVDNELFLNAPEEHQPKNVLEGARSVIVLSKLLPKSMFKVKNFQSQIVHRLYHSTYKFLDIAAARLCVFLESRGHYAVSIPSYVPLEVKKNGEPWGVISLKHAGVAAGLGQIAKNGLLIHPKYGTLNRLAAVITTAFLTPDEPLEENACSKAICALKVVPRKQLAKLAV